MNWDAIGAIGEIIGATAVVISLLYLASQIRHQNSEARLAAMHDISAGFRDTLGTIADGVMADVIHSAVVDYESLSPADSLRLIAGIGRVFRLWEEAYFLHEAGRLESRMWKSMLSQFNGYLSVRPFAEVWAIRKQYFDEEFRIFVDGLEREDYVFK